MRRTMWSLVAGVLLGLAPVLIHAAVTAQQVRALQVGKTTYAQVLAQFGQPSQVETGTDGTKAVAYVGSGAHLNATSVASLLGSVASVFVPGAAGLATSTASLAANSLAGGTEGNASTMAMLFDRDGRLVRYKAVIMTSSSGMLVGSRSSTQTISSEDGAAPMPNVSVRLTPAQIASIESVKWPADKPRLGIAAPPVSSLGPDEQAQFAAAKFDGMVIAYVLPGSVAEKAGLRVNDYLYMLNGTLVDSAASLAQAMHTVKIGDMIAARAIRIDQANHVAVDKLFRLQF